MILKGKKICFLGDSITEGVGVTDRENNRYDKRLERDCELLWTKNYGIGGTRLAHQSKPSARPRHDLCFAGRAFDLDPDADIIVVYGGVNDYLHGDAPFGEEGDTTPATFVGAVYFLMELMTTKYAGKTVVFMTPARSCHNGNCDEKVSPNSNKRPDARPAVAYVDVIKATAEKFGIPTLDLYRELGINPNDADDCKKYTVDGLHFNDDGHAVIAEKLRGLLESL